IAEGAAAWSDLSAAYYVKAGRIPARRVEYLARALDAAARSLRVAPSNEARFNRTLALDALASYVQAPAPWADYERSEPDPRWVAAAKRRTHATAAADARTSWDERRKQLLSRLLANDRAF